jgi:hypothetical protein
LISGWNGSPCKLQGAGDIFWQRLNQSLKNRAVLTLFCDARHNFLALELGTAIAAPDGQSFAGFNQTQSAPKLQSVLQMQILNGFLAWHLSDLLWSQRTCHRKRYIKSVGKP